MSVLKSYKHTFAACCLGYVAQAIVNNFAPLLFVMFHTEYGISLEKISLLVLVNFGTQLLIDLFSAKFVDKIGYRTSVIAAHVFAAVGMVSLGVLPDLTGNTFAGLCVAVVLYAIGGGLTETIVSPIVEACPTDGKSSAMSLLHSFYCWGSVAVVLISTLALNAFGGGSWRYIAFAWAVLPLANAVYFAFVPIVTLTGEGGGMKISELLRTKLFWILALLMFCSGASELAMSQWASAFAESGLKVSKTVGDIAGPCAFAVLMGLARLLSAKLGRKVDLCKYLAVCAAACIAGYLVAALSPVAVLSLVGCGICGFSVGAMWPGMYSVAAEKCPRGGTALFALLALGGDLGCMLGPATVGFVSGSFGDDLGLGLLVSALFPLLFIVGLILLAVHGKKVSGKNGADEEKTE